MIVPFGHGFKNVKFLQHIRLTNDYRPNDTYAAIDEGEEGNDPGSVQKTYTTVDQMRGAKPISIQSQPNIVLSGVLMNGRTRASHLEYWVRGPFPDEQSIAKMPEGDEDPELLAGPWVHENGSVRDLLAWYGRGWCRMEQVCNALSPIVKPVICATSASSVRTDFSNLRAAF